MASRTTTIHLVRHAEGHHQLANNHTDTSIHDPTLTPRGITQSRDFSTTFPYHNQTDLLCASPCRRTIQTALFAFAPESNRGLKIVALADAQEATDAPSDTGSDIPTIKGEFGDAVNYEYLNDDWYVKGGLNAVDVESLHARAKRLRRWLRARKEENIVVVTHGMFAHYVTGHIDSDGNQTGEWWNNVMWRTYQFNNDDEDKDATLFETDESIKRHDL